MSKSNRDQYNNMISNVTNYKKIIKTSNGDGTEKVEIIGCKIFDNNGNEIEANVVFPKVTKNNQTVLADYTINDDGELFTITIPDKK